ncbi:speedy protein 1-A-like [Pseudophryne corroboree]|uniref:speedy protein 1-A-like n=1 Tax=Pseudophryne corroboree TaxID=495146 RepID=UPI0030820F8F
MDSRSSPGPSTSSQYHQRKRKRGTCGQYGEEHSSSGSPSPCKWRRGRIVSEVKAPFLQPEERAAFYDILEDDHIKNFLLQNTGLRMSDKYLLAMVLVYYKRAGLKTEEYGRNFFTALFLANQVEEDEAFRREIYPWALGWTWRTKMNHLHQRRDSLLRRMDFRAVVDRATCDLVMAEYPFHWVWLRTRPLHHGWAVRWYHRHWQEYQIRGPESSPLPCALCSATLGQPIKWEVVGNNICRQSEDEPEIILKVIVQ